MKSGRANFSLIIVIILLGIFIIRRWQEPVKGEAFDRTPKQLQYTKHALCRMDCRVISKEDINEIMKKGIINFSKSDRNDRPCPTFALQGNTSDGESLRVVFAQCNDETRVVTCYNLKNDPECSCPNGERKNN
jgi:hypothetical protein